MFIKNQIGDAKNVGENDQKRIQPNYAASGHTVFSKGRKGRKPQPGRQPITGVARMPGPEL